MVLPIEAAVTLTHLGMLSLPGQRFAALARRCIPICTGGSCSWRRGTHSSNLRFRGADEHYFGACLDASLHAIILVGKRRKKRLWWQGGGRYLGQRLRIVTYGLALQTAEY